MTIGERLLELRKKHGLNQAELASELGVDRTTYAHWELDRRRPELNSLIQMADFFDVSIDYLVGRKGVTAAASRADDPMSDLPPEARKSVEEFIEFVRKRNEENKK